MQIGILGGGQLGRMLGLAGYPLGLRLRCFDTAADAVAGHIMPLTVGRFDDNDALAAFAEGLDLLTYEFENVPVQAAEFLAGRVPLFPPPAALAMSQDRIEEKRFFQRLGIPTAPFEVITGRGDFEKALASIGMPAVLKTTRLGYDGKGQAVIGNGEEAERAWEKLGGVPLILEGFVPFERELSVLAVRGRGGETAYYPLVENVHEDGILRRSRAPAPRLGAGLQAEAQGYAGKVMDALDYLGVLAIEFFQHRGRLVANELAPRVHNSGHWTIEGAQTSQFENHLRAICGWPLGSTRPNGEAAMVNIIGEWPAREKLLGVPGLHVHDYGKEALPRRKLGHVTGVAEDDQSCEAMLETVETIRRGSR